MNLGRLSDDMDFDYEEMLKRLGERLILKGDWIVIESDDKGNNILFQKNVMMIINLN